MDNLEHDGNTPLFSPKITMDASTGICDISGESYLEDTDSFYDPLIQWVRQYCNEVKKALTFNFHLTHFNTGSSKGIINILYILKKYEEDGAKVQVNWRYPDDDYDLAEEIEDFGKSTGLKFNLHPYKFNE